VEQLKLALLKNIRLGCKGLQGTNTLAYFQITALAHLGISPSVVPLLKVGSLCYLQRQTMALKCFTVTNTLGYSAEGNNDDIGCYRMPIIAPIFHRHENI
jgi:hypothetical protein